MVLDVDALCYILLSYCLPIPLVAYTEGNLSTSKSQQGYPVLTVDAIITGLDTTAAYVLIKARSVADQRPLTILSERDSSKHTLPKGRSSCLIQIGRHYIFRLQTTTTFKLTAPGKSPLYDLLHFEEYWIGKQRILAADELPYRALNMQGYRIEQ